MFLLNFIGIVFFVFCFVFVIVVSLLGVLRFIDVFFLFVVEEWMVVVGVFDWVDWVDCIDWVDNVDVDFVL